MAVKFYFTYGTSKTFPFKGGWTEVIAQDYNDAIKTFRHVHPDVHAGLVNCSDIYTEGYFVQSGMASGNLGACCHEVIYSPLVPASERG